MGLLENLVRIELRDCNNCKRLPPLGQLPLLKLLFISGMVPLECIGTELYGTTNSSGERRRVIFPSLEELEFRDMPNLEEWHDLEIKKDNQQAGFFPCLKQLDLWNCPNLISLPSLIPSSLHKLRLGSCDKVIVRLFPSLLHKLRLDSCNVVTSFPNGSLQNLDALEELAIHDYTELTCLPDELSNLASLKRLDIRNCPALRSLSQSLQNLSTLESLEISECDQLELSTEDFQHLIKLQSIRLAGLPKLTTSFPELHHLRSLEFLEIMDCNNLRVLPQGLQNLTSLWVLTVARCHCELHSRCKKDTGEYWPSIKHIPQCNIWEPREEKPPTTS